MSTCITVWCIDLNMIRAGLIAHPVKWGNSGYDEIQQPPKRYRVIDLPGLFGLCGFSKLADFQQAHRQWVEITLRGELSVRDARWSKAVAVGNLNFVEKMKRKRAPHRELLDLSGDWDKCIRKSLAKLTEATLTATLRL